MRIALLFFLAAAQSGNRTSFEVASIKFHPEPVTMSADPSIHGSRMTGTASTLLDLITAAYEVKYDQVSGGPGWIKSDHYDLTAKAEGEQPIPPQEGRQMLQQLLADRFQLKIHRELKEVPVYALVVGAGGPKFKGVPSTTPNHNVVRSNVNGMHIDATRWTMEHLVRQLSGSAGRPVVDRTGLTGYFTFQFDWQPVNPTTEPDPDKPSLFTTIQEQLGLKLEPSKAPINMLVIDSAAKPTAN